MLVLARDKQLRRYAFFESYSKLMFNILCVTVDCTMYVDSVTLKLWKP